MRLIGKIATVRCIGTPRLIRCDAHGALGLKAECFRHLVREAEASGRRTVCSWQRTIRELRLPYRCAIATLRRCRFAGLVPLEAGEPVGTDDLFIAAERKIRESDAIRELGGAPIISVKCRLVPGGVACEFEFANGLVGTSGFSHDLREGAWFVKGGGPSP